MALVPHKITALAESDAQGTDGKNIVSGAIVSLYDADGEAAILYDDENGSNGSTAKQTDATGQVVVYVTAGEYDEEVNGSLRRRVAVGGNGVVSYGTTAEIEATRPNKTGQRAENRERANAQYVLAAAGYVAQPGDIVAANGRVWALLATNYAKLSWFGVVGDGVVADDTTLQNALDSTVYELDGEGKTLKINSTMTTSNSHKLSNINFDFSTAPENDTLMIVNGASAPTISVTTPVAKGDGSITVTDASGLALGQKIILKSDDIFSKSGCIKAEFLVIKSITGNTLTLNSDALYDYNTNVVIEIPSFTSFEMENIELNTLDALNQRGFIIKYVDGLNVDKFSSFGAGNRSMQIEKCYKPTVKNSKFLTALSTTGLGYGIAVIGATSYGNFINCHAEDMRHGITIGGVSGACNLNTISGWTTVGCTDGGIDTHDAANFTIISNNIVDCSSSTVGASRDGMVLQGANHIVSNNIIKGFKNNGLLCQFLTREPDDYLLISDNTIISGNASGSGLFIETLKDSGSVSSISIDSNYVNTSGQAVDSVIIDMEDISVNVETVSMSNNTVYSGLRALEITIQSGIEVNEIVINGGSYKTQSSVTECILINSNDAGGVDDLVISGTTVSGGSFNLREINVTNAILTGSRLKGWASAAKLGDFTNGNIETA